MAAELSPFPTSSPSSSSSSQSSRVTSSLSLGFSFIINSEKSDSGAKYAVNFLFYCSGLCLTSYISWSPINKKYVLCSNNFGVCVSLTNPLPERIFGSRQKSELLPDYLLPVSHKGIVPSHPTLNLFDSPAKFVYELPKTLF